MLRKIRSPFPFDGQESPLFGTENLGGGELSSLLLQESQAERRKRGQIAEFESQLPHFLSGDLGQVAEPPTLSFIK